MEKNIANDKIDLVILWVDGNDKEWILEKNKYLHIKGDAGENRFRDCDNLQYLFRGIEKYAPWVNKVFFITWGHIPSWMDINNPKLRIVKHEEFIPKEYLPTFNSNVIELNLHRINDLSEKFVLFNDDLFILNYLEEKDFFENRLPKDYYIEYIKKNPSKRHQIMKKNYIDIIQEHFNKKDVLKSNFSKIFNFNYGRYLFCNILSAKNKRFNDFLDLHITQPFIKSRFSNVWNLEYEKLDGACKNRFRSNNDIGKNICRYCQLLEGEFIPYIPDGKYFEVSNNNAKLIDHILNRKSKIICINDAKIDIDFEKSRNEINNSLEIILPNRSKFEKI